MTFPTENVELTTILVVSDVDRARDFWRDVVGAEVYREYGGTSCVLRLAGAWILLVTGGGPTEDKPDVTFAVASPAGSIMRSPCASPTASRPTTRSVLGARSS